MKICPNCGKELKDDVTFCTSCGTRIAIDTEPEMSEQSAQESADVSGAEIPAAEPVRDRYDHTDQFSEQDVSDNRVICMCIYLLDVVGILFALVCRESAYVRFHVTQALKIKVIESLVWICASVLSLILMAVTGRFGYFLGGHIISALKGAAFAPIGIAIAFSLLLCIIRIITFFQICAGKAKEPVIIRRISFL